MNEVKNPKRPMYFYYGIVLIVLLLLNMFAMPYLTERQVQEVDYGTFMQMTEKHEIGKVEVEQNQIVFTNKDESKIYKTGIMDDPQLTQRLYDSGAKFSSDIVEQMSPLMSFIVSWGIPLLIFFALGQWMSKRLMKNAGGANSMMFGMGKSNAKVYVKSSEGIRFADVAGEDEAKEKAPCIVFIDEIDAIGQKRNAGNFGGNDEREQTLNQLLTEMDGFEDNSGVIILAATNRPESLDPALTRPGRFDRRVPVELPDLKGREEILKVHARKVKVASDVDFNKIARMASGASGAELANIVNEAALRAVRDGRKFATQADLEESIEVVIAGYEKKNAILSDNEKWTVAIHEIGHALVAALQSHSAPVQKITIIPRTSGALGYTMQVDEDERYIMTKEELENKIATLTGGRAAEEVMLGTISTGAANDIEQATKLARAMISRYGMSKDFGMVALETVTNQYLGGDASLACSAETQTKIDEQVVALVQREHDKAGKILLENRDKLRELSEYLYQKETITGKEFMEILNR